MYVLLVGLNHKTAPVEVREKMTFTKGQLPAALKKLSEKEHIEGCAILSTCNRTEVYATAKDAEKGLSDMKEFIKSDCNLSPLEMREHMYTKTLYEAVRHLFYVASGLDSMILGESQILGQVKDAYEVALQIGSTNGVLNTFFQHAITVGKKVRSETAIDQNPVSVSYVAVELAKQFFKDLSKHKVLVIGAGEMSILTAKHLVANGVETVMVSNRSFDKAKQLAEQFGGEAVSFSELFERMVETDIVISATGARHYIIYPENIGAVMEARKGKSLFMIDIAVPRDIHPAVKDMEGVKLHDIDELRYVVDKNLEQRKEAAMAAEEIIDAEINDFFKWLGSLFVVPTIVALRDKAEKIKQSELNRAFNRLAPLTDREKKVIGSMANSIVKQLLHDPIINLKKYANTSQGHLYSEILQNLFDLEVEGQKKKKKDTKQLITGSQQ
ncbi:MAG: glutamyl-tRNA reductase [Clostridia bacterium]|jgi:glutamyl-tRNA reductase|nr:glutamyl-tRNA reductase [Clostridia bacterium]